MADHITIRLSDVRDQLVAQENELIKLQQPSSGFTNCGNAKRTKLQAIVKTLNALSKEIVTREEHDAPPAKRDLNRGLKKFTFRLAEMHVQAVQLLLELTHDPTATPREEQHQQQCGQRLQALKEVCSTYTPIAPGISKKCDPVPNLVKYNFCAEVLKRGDDVRERMTIKNFILTRPSGAASCGSWSECDGTSKECAVLDDQGLAIATFNVELQTLESQLQDAEELHDCNKDKDSRISVLVGYLQKKKDESEPNSLGYQDIKARAMERKLLGTIPRVSRLYLSALYSHVEMSYDRDAGSARGQRTCETRLETMITVSAHYMKCSFTINGQPYPFQSPASCSGKLGADICSACAEAQKLHTTAIRMRDGNLCTASHLESHQFRRYDIASFPKNNNPVCKQFGFPEAIVNEVFKTTRRATKTNFQRDVLSTNIDDCSREKPDDLLYARQRVQELLEQLRTSSGSKDQAVDGGEAASNAILRMKRQELPETAELYLQVIRTSVEFSWRGNKGLIDRSFCDSQLQEWKTQAELAIVDMEKLIENGKCYFSRLKLECNVHLMFTLSQGMQLNVCRAQVGFVQT